MPVFSGIIRKHPWRGVLPDFCAAAMKHPPLWTSAVTIRRSAYQALRPVVSRSRTGQDHHLWMQFVMHYPTAFDTTVTAFYHYQTSGNISSTVTYYEELPHITYLRELLESGALHQLGVNEHSVRALIWKFELQVIRRILHHGGNRDLAKELLRRYIPNSPLPFLRWLRYVIQLNVLHRVPTSAIRPE